jgi:hypothetical protein
VTTPAQSNSRLGSLCFTAARSPTWTYMSSEKKFAACALLSRQGTVRRSDSWVESIHIRFVLTVPHTSPSLIFSSAGFDSTTPRYQRYVSSLHISLCLMCLYSSATLNVSTVCCTPLSFRIPLHLAVSPLHCPSHLGSKLVLPASVSDSIEIFSNASQILFSKSLCTYE